MKRIWEKIQWLWQVFQAWRLQKSLESQTKRWMDHTGNLVTVKTLLDRRASLKQEILRAARNSEALAEAKARAQLELVESLLNGSQ